MPKSCENAAKIVRKFCENYPKIIRKASENRPKIVQQSCEHHANIMRKSCEHRPKIVRKSFEHHAKIMRTSYGNHPEIMRLAIGYPPTLEACWTGNRNRKLRLILDGWIEMVYSWFDSKTFSVRALPNLDSRGVARRKNTPGGGGGSVGPLCTPPPRNSIQNQFKINQIFRSILLVKTLQKRSKIEQKTDPKSYLIFYIVLG